MGYVHKPIPHDILANMPPHVRREAIQREREFLLRVSARQGRTAGFGWAIVAALIAIAALLYCAPVAL